MEFSCIDKKQIMKEKDPLYFSVWNFLVVYLTKTSVERGENQQKW